MIDFTPSPIAFQLGPISFPWYGIGYAVGLFLAASVIMHEAKRRGLNPDLVPNGMIVVAIAALIGGRLYHVIDQWQLYRDDLLKIVLPPYSGLGAYGGLLTGILALFLYTRWKRLEFWTWMDIAAPGVFVMQAVARWGNFFNQELYGPPTNLPWGIAIDCAHRVAEYACPPGSDPTATLGQHFQPMFLYESLSGAIGAITLLWLARRFGPRLRPGDLAMVFIIWYALVRFALEYMREGYNWTFFGVPTAQVVSLGFVAFAILVLIWRHRPGAMANGERADADAGARAAASVPDGGAAAVGVTGAFGGSAGATSDPPATTRDLPPERRPTDAGAVPTPPA
jgi:phosphatidylglycerol:prolipoprotein diacylglycerol transferase